MAFTGNFFKRREDSEGLSNVIEFDAVKQNYPDLARIIHYLEYCDLYNQTPRRLLAQANKGQEIVIAEMINTGTGLASFLSAWTALEDPAVIKDLSEAIQFFVYDTMPNDNKDTLVINNDGSSYSFPLIRRHLSFEQGEIMQNTSSINECAIDSSRLVPMYHLSRDREHKGLDICFNTPKVKNISQILYREIEKVERYNQRSENINENTLEL